MHFLTFGTCFAIASTLGAYTVNQGDDPFSSYIKGAEYIGNQEKGYLHNLITTLPAFPSIPFAPEDYELIKPQLLDPEVLRALVVDNKVNLNTYGLTVSPREAEDALLTLSGQVKDAISERIKESIHYKTKLPSKEEVTKRIHATIDRLSQVDDLETALLTKLRAKLDANPEYVEYVKILVTALPSTFEHDVLGYLRNFFKEANDYDIEVTDKLRSVIAKLQQEYSLFPEEYYQKLAAAIARPVDVSPIYSK